MPAFSLAIVGTILTVDAYESEAKHRKDAEENNIFEGGFLGLDNIGVFDRNHLPPGCGLL